MPAGSVTLGAVNGQVGNNNVNGRLDEVELHHVALSAARVRARYDAAVCAPAATPTATATAPPPPTWQYTPTPPGGPGTLNVLHYHLDHLGSVQVITRPDRSVFAQIRYKPYGEERYRSVDTCGTDNYCHQFTQYDTEPISGLEYAGARVYDPALGQFLTHDPARQFASPYTYTNWNPVNATDPTGALTGVEETLILAAIMATFSAYVTFMVGVTSGQSVGAAALSALESGAIAGATTVGLAIVDVGVAQVFNSAAAGHYAAAGVGAAAGAYQGVESGHYEMVFGAVTAALASLYAAGLLGAQPAKAGTTTDNRIRGNFPKTGAPEWKGIQKKFDLASIPPTSEGEIMIEYGMNGIGQGFGNIERYGSPFGKVTRSMWADSGKPIKMSNRFLVNPDTQQVDPAVFGHYHSQIGDLTKPIDIILGGSIFDADPDFFTEGLFHEWGHFHGMSEYDAQQFQIKQMKIIKSNRGF